MTGRVQGKVALITGAASGMGRTHAQLLAEQGADIFVTDVNEAGLAETVALVKPLGVKVASALHDVADEVQWQQIADQAQQTFGRVDILVNNAGIAMPRRLEETTTEEWDLVMAINAKGPFLGCRTILPLMKPAGGSIINISSAYGMVGGPNAAAYNASKGAVRMLTKGAAIDLARYGIRVNSVHPGVIRTSMTEEYINDPSIGEMLLSTQIQKRAAEPREVSQVVLFLASDESSFVTGAEYTADGGFTAQ